MLAKSFVIAEEESLTIFQWPPKSRAKLIALEGWGRALIKIIRCVKCAVSKKFIYAAVKFIGSGLSHDGDLSTGALAVLGTIGIAQYIEFPHCVHSQQLLTAPTRLHVVFGRAGKFHSIEQEDVLLRAIAGYGKVVACRGIRDTNAARLLPGEVHNSGIEHKQQIVAAPVERQILDLSFTHQAGNVLRREIHNRSIFSDLYLFADFADTKSQIGACVLPYCQTNAGADAFRKAVFGGPNLVQP